MAISKKIFLTSLATSVLILAASIFYTQRTSVEVSVQAENTIAPDAGAVPSADTILLGSTTPEETMRKLVAALKNQNVQGAVQYFTFDANGSRERWTATLMNIKAGGMMPTMASDIEKYRQPSPDNVAGADTYAYAIQIPGGAAPIIMTLRKDPSTGLWSIAGF